jgi:hypothetical protein
MEMALKAFRGNGHEEGTIDADDPYVRIVFRDLAPLEDDRECFERMAHVLWDPILEAATKIEIPGGAE